MVEKVSRASVTVPTNGGSSQDEGASLQKIIKNKKKQTRGEETLPIIPATTQSLVRLPNETQLGGGVQQKEQKALTMGVPANFEQEIEFRHSHQGANQQRRIALSTADRLPLASITPQAASAEKAEKRHAEPLFLASAQPQAASVEKDEKRHAGALPRVSVMPQTVGVEKVEENNRHQPILANNAVKPSVKVEKNNIANHKEMADVQPMPLTPVKTTPLTQTAVFSQPQTVIRRPQSSQTVNGELGDVSAILQAVKSPESLWSKQNEMTPHHKDLPGKGRQFKTPANGVASVAKQSNKDGTLEVNYQFQRWSGDHSVKISIPIEMHQAANVRLLPSDAHAAEMLQRNLGQLTGLTADLLQPQQEKDEQRHRQQRQQDEELE